MAKILPFANPAPARKRPVGQGPAEIMIFPGVRVEYHEEPVRQPRRRSQSRKRNDAAEAS